MIRYFGSGDTIPDVGEVEMMTDTGYRLVDGTFVPFVKVHPRPSVVGLVTFDDGTRYGGAPSTDRRGVARDEV